MSDPDFDSTDIADFAQAARLLFSAGSVQDTLNEVVNLAVTTIEGCDFAGIFLISDGSVTTPAQTHRLVTEVDELQHDANEGPCLDAIARGTAFYSGDLAEDERWPSFGPKASASGLRSLLAVPMLDNGPVGALNLYSRYPDAFGVIGRARGLLLASVSALAFATARTHEDEERRAANLQLALATREIIGQAQGILMERERITADEAFDILRRASQHLNLKLREVAQRLVETGERPDTGRADVPPSPQ
ncbi:MAG: ANTAR domain-containing protein [Acidimicrobiales bacterium]